MILPGTTPFSASCDEALAFYGEALGAEVTVLMRFKECPDPEGCPPGSEEKVMHCNFTVRGTQLMASDGQCAGKADFQGFALSLSVETPDEAEQIFAALAKDGQIQMPMAETFFSPRFGMLADRFGVPWMVLVHPG